MRENRTSGSEGGEAQTNELSLPLSYRPPSNEQPVTSNREAQRSPAPTGWQ